MHAIQTETKHKRFTIKPTAQPASNKPATFVEQSNNQFVKNQPEPANQPAVARQYGNTCGYAHVVCRAVGGVGDSDSRNSPGHSGTPDGGGGDCLLCDGFIC